MSDQPIRLLDAEALRRKRTRQDMPDEEKTANPWWPSAHITDALDTLHNDGIRKHYDTASDDTFVECRICGEWEGHTDECPWPAIDKWMGGGD